jgi:ATP-binding cassette subfamily B protein
MSNHPNEKNPAVHGHAAGRRPGGVRPGFGPGHGPPGMIGEKPKNFKRAIGQLIAYLGRYKYALFAVLLFAAGSTVFSIVGPKILGNAITELFNGLVAKVTGTGGIDFDKIASILLFLLVLYGISSLLSFVQGWIMTGIAQKVSYRMRQEISEKINRMPLKYFEGNTVGDVLSRITNDVDLLGNNLNQSITQLITSTATIIGVTVMMLSISPVMTLAVFVILPVSVLLMGFIMKFTQKYFGDQQKYLGKANGLVEEVYGGHVVVKAFNREEAVQREFDDTNGKLYESAWKSQFFSGMMFPLMMFVGNLGYVLVTVLGSFLAIRGSITVGDIQAFIQYVRNFTQPITQLSQVSGMLQGMAAAAERVFEFLNEEEETAAPESPVSVEGIRGEVRFEHVRFGYTPDKTVIRDFNCEVKPGQTVAIVGPTGAGKTTIVKLLMRFYDVTDGRITIDGHDLRAFERHELRSLFGMVLQDTWLFKGTIMENIRYGKPDASDEDVIEAAKAAFAHNFILNLPGGYQMELNEDATNVSQGQKQLLTIARAFLANRPILILDEATSSVDTRTERRIQRAMENLMKGRTSFVIAHRLSTIQNADLILVMKDGDIIEQGTHEELLAKGGFYADLYNSQFEQVS